MRVELLVRRSRPVSLIVAAGLTGLLLSGCTRDPGRYDDLPNLFGTRTFEDDSSAAQSASTRAVETQPLNAPAPNYANAQPSYAPSYGTNTAPTAPTPIYQQQSSYTPATTGSVNARPPEAGWQWEGGTPITVQPGETADSLSRRYGVPVWALLRANNLSDASRIYPGARLVIPKYHGNATAYAPANPEPRAVPRAAAPARGDYVHIVNSGETLYSLSRRYNVSHASIARANGIGESATLTIGQRLIIPGRTAAVQPRRDEPARSERRVDATAPAAAPTAEGSERVAAVKPVEQSETSEPEPVLGDSPQFRWPVRGRIISGFGKKPNGQHNDGINLAVPEGTEVKAAESGVVAYAGNELKGYGNLVLIRHPDGWVTAYAHNSQLLVRRGDKVRRGQTIARAGQTGGVTTPQVHFEIRKGSTPVDPGQYLSSL